MEILVIIILCCAFAFYKSYKGEKIRTCEENQYQEIIKTPYMQLIPFFLEFYNQLPHKSFLILTPGYIGVPIQDEDFAISVLTYLHSVQRDPADILAYQKILSECNKNALGGEHGVHLFQTLNLQAFLHDNDEDSPVVYMKLMFPEYDYFKRAIYAKAIEKQYFSLYYEEIKVYNFDNY